MLSSRAQLTGSFLPSPDFLKYVAAHILAAQKNHEDPLIRLWAEYALRRLARAVHRSKTRSSYRQNHPCISEMICVKVKH
jgi:hypothetical protein